MCPEGAPAVGETNMIWLNTLTLVAFSMITGQQPFSFSQRTLLGVTGSGVDMRIKLSLSAIVALAVFTPLGLTAPNSIYSLAGRGSSQFCYNAPTTVAERKLQSTQDGESSHVIDLRLFSDYLTVVF